MAELNDEQQNTGQFSACIVTNIGKEMIAKSQNGQKLTFTRVALGDGLIETDDDILSFTKIKNERLSANIAKFTDKNNGQFQIQFRVSNQDVEVGFWEREIGIMAQLEGGEEQLYAYSSAGNKANFLYDKTTPVEERIVNIDFVVGNAENVQVIVNSSIIYVSLEDMEETMATHDTNADSHETAFAQHNNDENAHQNLIDMLMEVIENSGINILKRNKAYNVGDIAYSTKITSTTHLASKLYLECTEAGTSGASEPMLTNVNLNDEITDGTAKFKIYDVGLQSLPVGSIYQSTIATGPDKLFGGTWEAMPAGSVLLAQGESDWGTTYEAGSTGGEATHQLTVGEMPSHNHAAISNTTNINGQVLIGASNAQMATFGHSGVITPVSTYPELYVPNNATRATVPGGAVINANITPKITINNAGGGQPHNNMQPYLTVYMWKRTE
ncbi:MAG: tail-collar fiber protein [Bacteriophage sp.]|nr:MAG: tail-collar fiber protein [Bacteriophage sp.]